MGSFGWSLPPGCGTLPGEEPEYPTNEYLKLAFPEYASIGALYRVTYKYTACGPWLSAEVSYWTDEGQFFKTVHSDRLHELGTWDEMDKRGECITRIYVGSIVEGVDYDTDTIELVIDQDNEEPEAFAERFNQAVEEIDQQATCIWNDTHGCETCAQHWAGESGVPVEEVNDRWEAIPVWAECPDCQGGGIVK